MLGWCLEFELAEFCILEAEGVNLIVWLWGGFVIVNCIVVGGFMIVLCVFFKAGIMFIWFMAEFFGI